MKKLMAVLMVIGLVAGASYGAAVWTEDFSDSSGFVVNNGVLAGDGDEDYFVITDGTDIDHSYTGVSGSYLAGQDTDDVDAAGVGEPQIQWSSIDITGYSDLSFKGSFAEVGPEADSVHDIDRSDYLLVEYQIDTGGWNNLISFRNDGSTYNSPFYEDTDFDGIGDGTTITSSDGAMVEFTKSISGAGNLLDLRFTHQVDSGDEDFAADSFSIIPEPTTFALFGLLAAAALIRRRLFKN